MPEELDILFVGGLFPREKKEEIFSKSKNECQTAADALQWNIINGLEAQPDVSVTILSAIFVSSYPSYYSDIYVEPYRFSHRQGSWDYSIGFLNIFGIKHIWKALAIKRQVIEWARRGKGGEKRAIIIYSPHTPFIYAVAAAKQVDPDIHVCIIVPDLPEFMTLSEKKVSKVKKIIKLADIYVMKKYMQAIDTFVLLTKFMSERIPVGSKPRIVIEGVVPKEDREEPPACPTEKAVLYTGTLHRAYGIGTLLEAFKSLGNPDYRLWICGFGETEDEIRTLAETDSRVKFFGLIPREEVLALQRKAKVLINPRNAEGEFTRYSFPSKNMEYLLSGRPVIAYKLPGIPDEYDNHFFYVPGNTVAEMAATMEKVFSQSDRYLDEFGQKARRFVLNEKNNVIQSKRIVDMIRG